MVREMMIEGKRVIDELEQGKELANRLMNNLKRPCSDQINQSLISEILCSYDKAILLLSLGSSQAGQRQGSSDMDFKNAIKKRKLSEKESETVKVCVGKGKDGACIGDGYYWRKYGQKEILGSKNPRGYYRCAHRFSQGCLAVKQVQKSDTDPSVFEVKYLGTHTCNVTPAAAAKRHVSVRKTEHKSVQSQNREQQIESIILSNTKKSDDVMLNLDEEENKKAIFRTFSFSNYGLPENAEWKNEIFPENLMENLSPATSGSVITTSELMSAPTSATNSPTGDSYFSLLDNIIDFKTDFTFDSYLERLS